MRALLVTDSPEPSGVGEHMLILAAALAAEGVQAVLAFPDHDAGRRLVDRAQASGLPARIVMGDWHRAIAQACADLVHVHAGIGWEGHELTRIARDTGAAVIRTEHLPWLLTEPGQIREYAAASAHVDAVIAVSREAGEGWRRAARRMPGPRLPVAAIANGIKPAALPRADGNAAPTILCVGRFTPQKLHRTLIVALARLHCRGTPARLQLVGGGPLQERLELLVRRLDLTASVDFLGRRDDVPELMSRADVLALPSAFEGLPLVLLEAMALGLPAVATRIGGSVEALGPDHPWLVPFGRSRDLAQALEDALDNLERRAITASRQAARFAQRFTAARMAADTARIYRAALRHRTGDRMDRVRLGFIGAGGIAHRHFGVLETMPDVAVVAVTDPDQGRAEDAARRMGATAYPDFDSMLADADLDAVYICIPPFAHGPAERACIARGLPFFVEKPISLDIELAEEIAEEVAAAGLITAVGYHWRYLDTMDEARAHLAHNPAHLMQGFWIDQTPPPEWWWREDRSGGQVVEQATHIIDAARFLAGDVTEVFGLSTHRERGDFPGLTVPTATAATLRFASGAVANLGSTCLLRWNHRVGLHVFSDAMALEITDHDLMVDVGQGRPVRHAQGDPVWREDRDFVEAVMGRENRIRCPYAEALETHRVALAITRSAQANALVKMEVLRADPQPIFRPSLA
ncbi:MULTISPECIES: glycosyltransferase [unclassified Paracoccus (in: a-proteobacteria)]|uniref:glycosyltransferase n=1 Tax=unclassified Paracoccus (in: a-proteobacteria) TaxID=2688777 RepID=UPI00190D17A1|nr:MULTISPECIES: glycosyltransferase [unclassified Paracoccus (in: a-proteobacteria)]QQO45271.1 glycosyltransferase [Paracoccus sp. MC1862]